MSAEETILLISRQRGVVVIVRIETVERSCIASQAAIVEHRRARQYLISAKTPFKGASAKRAKKGHV